MKTKPEIAKEIIERRSRPSSTVMQGEMLGLLGHDGMVEALNQRWLLPDVDSGFLTITNDRNKIEEMHALAEIKPENYKPEAVPVTESHDFVLNHTQRRNVIQEIAAPGTGSGSPSLTAVGQPTSPQIPVAQAAPPTTPTAPVAPASPAAAPAMSAAGSFQVGSPVQVGRGGQSAMGVIEKLMPDGRYSVSYPPNATKPPGDNIYSKEELSAVQGQGK